MTVIYGIKNCDTMKKAMKWLDENTIQYSLHDYKKQGIDETVLKSAIAEHGWETVINQRGTTWRQLPENVKASMNTEKALEIANENPSIIKRPLLRHKQTTYVGFKPETYLSVFG